MIGRLVILGMAVLWVVAVTEILGVAAEPQAGPPPAYQGSGMQPAQGLVYVPPKVGAPRGRVGGAGRGGPQGGAADALPSVSVLAPDHPGLTLEAQPTLYWYLSRSANVPIEFTIMTDEATRPVFEIRISDAGQAGVHRLRLADYEVRLEPGVPYRWYVTLVPDPARRSRDIVAGGVIERVAPPAGLEARLAAAPAAEAPRLYAEAGLWYNAIGSLSGLIEAAPNDSTFKAQRAGLLEQVGLQEVASYDRHGAGAK